MNFGKRDIRKQLLFDKETNDKVKEFADQFNFSFNEAVIRLINEAVDNIPIFPEEKDNEA